ncbi:MAG TPA: redoxin domain-containing protein [Ktedonobacterales bacterium]|nr:redoxin domain-containing protein [Ktedonobacterales bacterium]
MSGVPTGIAAPGRGPRVGELLPLFTLPNTCDRAVRLWDFKQRRPVVVLVIHGAECAACRRALAELAARQPELGETRTAVLVIAPDSAARLAALRAELALPFTLLADASGEVIARYAPGQRQPGGAGPVALYVADCYGECGLASLADEADALATPDDVLAELALGEQGACSCLVPAWADPAEA